MSEKKLAYDFFNTPEGIRSQKIFDMRDRIRRLEASNAELLAALEAANRFITNGLEYGYIDLAEEDTSGMHTIDAIRQAIRKTKGWMES